MTSRSSGPVDSGCGRSVIGAKQTHGLGYRAAESPQSLRGHCSTGSGGEQYKNKGKVELAALDENSKAVRTGFNVADGVDQCLGSVAEMNDAGNLVIFDAEGSAAIPASSPEAATIRRALQRAARAAKIHRRKNTFFIPLWVHPQKPELPFTKTVQRGNTQ